MLLTGQQQIGASQQRVWHALNDPAILRASIPGCESLEQNPDGGFAAVVAVKIGPIGARFNGAIALQDLVPPDSYTLVGEGKGGMTGHAKGQARVRLAPAGNGTLLSYEVDVDVGGRLAQLGGPVVEATAKQLAARFFSAFETNVTGAAVPAAATGAVPAAPPSGPTDRVWPWLATISVAMLAAFMLGRSEAQDWWAAAMIGLTVLAALAGYRAGKGGDA